MERAIIRTGTIDADVVEANPIVFKGKLYIFEYIRDSDGDRPAYHAGETGRSCFRFLDAAARSYTPAFGHGLHMGCAMADGGKVYVTAVENWGASRFYVMESSDLEHWSEPRVILEDPRWAGYNTSCCRAGDRFVMVFELGKPKELVGVPFTMFFAESTDMRHFRMLPEAVFGHDFYTGAPMLRYFDGWFYFFYLDSRVLPGGYVTCAARSRDLKTWEISPRPVLMPDEAADRRIAPDAAPGAWRETVAGAEDRNASDIDMISFGGRLEMVYSWGNQHGTEFLARAYVPDCDEAAFCRSFFA